jgi:hypothetical protein
MTTNEAAERLRDYLAGAVLESDGGPADIEEAENIADDIFDTHAGKAFLAAAKREGAREAVERIRTKLSKTIGVPGLQATYLLGILDEEAVR